MAEGKNLPARRTSAEVSGQGTRFPETRSRNEPIYATITEKPPPRTEYVYVQDAGTNARRGAARFTPPPHQQANVPRPVPTFFGNSRVIGYSWVVSMVVVSFDEWHNNNILPRPSRLWWTTVTYGILALASMIIPVMMPIWNALAVGYTIMLIWQYFNGEGQFAK